MVIRAAAAARLGSGFASGARSCGVGGGLRLRSRRFALAPRAAPSADRAASADRDRATSAMAELGDRLQREDLRLHLGLEVEHDAQRIRPRRAEANRRRCTDRGACTRDGSCASSGVASTPSRSSTTRCGSFSMHELMRDRRRRLEDDARVFLRRPHARRRDARGAMRPRRRAASMRGGQRRSHGSARRRSSETRDQSGAFRRRTRERSRRGIGSPRSVCARARERRARRRCRRGCASVSARSAGGSSAATRSGHSTRQTASSRKQSAKPAVSHSLGSANR